MNVPGRKRLVPARLGATMAVACALVASAPAHAVTAVLTNAIEPVGSLLYVAKPDGSGERPLLADGRFEYDASFSADGRWIVFTSEARGPANIYRVHPDGSGLQQLTDDDGFDDQAALSPDNRRLALVSTRKGGVANIWIKNLKSGRLTNLTGALPYEPGKLHDYLRPSWSPDGRWLAFSSDRDTQFEQHHIPTPGWENIQRASVYVLRADGTGLRRLSDGGEYAGSPKWSADGRRVVYYSLSPDQTFAARIVGMGVAGLEAKDIPGALISVDVASGARTRLPALPGLNVSPQFLPDGRVGYLRKGPNVPDGKIAYSGPAGGVDYPPGPAPGDICNPAWSPDGSAVVYQKYAFGLRQGQPMFSADKAFALRFTGEFPSVSAQGKVAFTPFPHKEGVPPESAVWVANPDGSDMHRIYGGAGAAMMSPTWSPDGDELVVSKGVMKIGAPMQLVLIKADGEFVRTVSDPKLSSAFASYAPDGRHVVFRVKGAETGLRILDLKTGATQTLTTGKDNFPYWSPDGGHICFTRDVGGVEAFDIFTIRPDGSGLNQLTHYAGNDSHCAWMPDGNALIFSSSHLGHRDEAPLYDHGMSQPYAELFYTRLDGTDVRQITDDKWEEGTPAVLPTGG